MEQHKWQLVLAVLMTLLVAACSSPGSSADAPGATDAMEASTPQSQAEPPVEADEGATINSADTTTDEGAATAEVSAVEGNPQECVDTYDPNVDYFPDKVVPAYSQQWQVEYANNYKVVTTNARVGLDHEAGTNFIETTYVLIQCGTLTPELTGELADAIVIEIPVQRIVDGEDSLFAAFELLEVVDHLVGYGEYPIFEKEAPYLPTIYERMSSGAMPPVGYSEVNLEILADLEPDVYIKPHGDTGIFQQIQDLGIPIVFYNPYFEPPLGSSEQSKFLALFFNREALANAHFAGVESRYMELRELAQQAPQTPRVLLGTMSPGRDFSSRQNDYYESILIRDSGGERVLDLPGDQFQTIAWETVVEQGSDADFWFHLAFNPRQQTAAEFIEADPRAESIQALKAGNAFHRYGARGQDYQYNGQLNPDMVLADLISILHPELMPDHELAFLQPIPGE